MKKYLFLITISLALLATTILAGLVFRPTFQTDTSSQSPAPLGEDGTMRYTSVSYAPDTPAAFSAAGAVNGPAVFLNFPAGVDSNTEYMLVSESVAQDFIESKPAICTHFDTPVKAYSTLQEQASQPYWQRVKMWLTPAEDQVTLLQNDIPLNDYILVNGDMEQWHLNCPTLVDEDV